MEAAAAPGWRCRPGGRLDMSHGFVRHIRRNQLARYRHPPGITAGTVVRWGPRAGLSVRGPRSR
ncbi:hypothetical protein DV515_00020004 [Chloebia gouldiae]|uniref:Uncharacterized protein n=1 Tax=Chloebia gouldiae TaxID=44316 RepID=A0A3L8Q2S8_CHLGU|nr:hypothetical protein DV515_00020004 [Chloebia gouldiae]